jgi:hypothetical protein
MRSPTAALLWEVWRRHRIILACVLALTAFGRGLEARSTTPDSDVVVDLLRMLSFLLVFGIFSYTESSDSRGLGRFPRRLFVLPVSSLRLVEVPVLAGVASVEFLYLLWLAPVSPVGLTTIAFNATLLGALMVGSQAAIWTLDRLGPFRLVLVGLLAVGAFWVSLLPGAAPSPPPMWRSELGLTALTVAVAIALFVGAWRHIIRARSGGWHIPLSVETVVGASTRLLPRRRRAYRSPTAAHFWLEWRCSGIVLPLLVTGVLVTVVGPLSWLMRHDAGDTLRLLAGTLAVPVLLAVAVGIGFAKPTFWSEDLTLPAFIAVRPLSAEDIVAIKVKVAAASAAVSWLLVLAFVSVWLTFWGNLDSLSRLAIQLWAFHGQSVAAVIGIAVLTVTAAIFMTWRLLVTRLWTGLSGRRFLFLGSAVSVGLAVLVGLLLDATRLPGWVLQDPAHMNSLVFIAAAAVVAKYGLAAYAWRHISPTYQRQYLIVWVVGTLTFGALALVLWNIVRIYVALDIYRFQSLMILLALLATPLARLGFAPERLARNRHR